MSGDDVQRLYDMMQDVRDRLTAVETQLDAAIKGPIDVKRLRWDGKAINYIITRVVSPILITVLLGGSAFYYGIHCEINNLKNNAVQNGQNSK